MNINSCQIETVHMQRNEIKIAAKTGNVKVAFKVKGEMMMLNWKTEILE